MNDLKRTGAPSMEELTACATYPSMEVFRKGPTLVVECIEEIPCNPCETSCPQGAITVGDPIINLPQIDRSKCTTCGLCIAACPGLAVYMKDYTYSENTATVSFPYEYYPLPTVGQTVTVVGRLGEPLCQGTVRKVANPKVNNKTAVITVEYPKEYFEAAVNMKRL